MRNIKHARNQRKAASQMHSDITTIDQTGYLSISGTLWTERYSKWSETRWFFTWIYMGKCSTPYGGHLIFPCCLSSQRPNLDATGSPVLATTSSSPLEFSLLQLSTSTDCCIWTCMEEGTNDDLLFATLSLWWKAWTNVAAHLRQGPNAYFRSKSGVPSVSPSSVDTLGCLVTLMAQWTKLHCSAREPTLTCWKMPYRWSRQISADVMEIGRACCLRLRCLRAKWSFLWRYR